MPTRHNILLGAEPAFGGGGGGGEWGVHKGQPFHTSSGLLPMDNSNKEVAL